jgi:multicomponent Na+:H+ antiporter subunit G
MKELVVLVLLLLGAAFLLLAALGVLRMPDVFMRMSAATKASSLGAGLVVLAVALYFGDLATVTRALAVIAFLLLTVPVASHLIGRAAYIDGAPLWERTVVDELAGHYDEALAHRSGRPTVAPTGRRERAGRTIETALPPMLDGELAD